MQATEAQIVESRVVHARRELVFQMFTDAEHVSNWWGREDSLRRRSRWMFIRAACGSTR